MLHQFLALAWLVSNRLLLLETSRDDVPETLTGLKMQYEGTVDRVFGVAVGLQRLTPRRVCRVLAEACYGGGRGGDDLEASLSGQAATNLRVSTLEGLRAAGIVMVDATQVAEILLASSAANNAGKRGRSRGGGDEAAEGKESSSWGAAGNGGRFVLLDCRPQGPAAAAAAAAAAVSSGAAVSASSGVAEMEEAIKAREKGAAGGEVIWRRIKPKAYLAQKSTALADLLTELSAPPTEVRVAQEGGGLSEIELGVGLEASGHGFAEEKSADNGDSGNAATAPNGGDARRGSGGGATTHICFVGTGKWGGGKGGGGGTNGASVAAAGPPESRLARAASRSCLTSHVCVLEGGFPALEAALRQRTSEAGSENADATPLENGVESTPLVSGGAVDAPDSSTSTLEGVGSGADGGTDAEPLPRRGREATGAGEATYVADTGVSFVEQPETLTAAATAAAAAGRPPPGEKSSPLSPGEAATSDSLSPEGVPSASGESGVSLPPPLVTTPSTSLERKICKLACSSKISESFRTYAANSADEMGRGLRSLPLAASKPLEVRIWRKS